MGELFFTILFFFGVIAITAILFGGWIVYAIIRLIARLVSGPFRSEPSLSQRRLHQVRCARPGCATSNPSRAKFCRRCGATLADVQRVHVRRAAML